jgi:hypothetical protein
MSTRRVVGRQRRRPPRRRAPACCGLRHLSQKCTPIGCMLAWGPQCMPDGKIENVGGSHTWSNEIASRAPASEAGPNFLPGFASRGMEKFAPPGNMGRLPLTAGHLGNPNSFQSNAPQTHSRMSAAAGTSILLALTVPDRRRRRAIPWPILWRV